MADMSLMAPLVVLLTILAGGCSRNHEITEITLERKGCLGPCRIYKVTLRKDGSAVYAGKQNVDHIGTFRNSSFWPITYDFVRLSTAIEKSGFDRLAADYSLGWVDAEVVATTVVRGGQSKTVVTHNSSRDPNELWQVDTLIDGVVAGIQWEKQD